MAAIRLEGFQGLMPRVSARLLPPMAATIANNTKLLNGEIRGFRELREVFDFTSLGVTPVRRAFRIPGSPTDSYLLFDTKEVDVVRSPIINDLHDRYFWAGDGRPKMNTAARIENGDPEYFLGVPTPVTAPSVTPPGGADETRAYVYTFVSAFGEEGPPSPPTLITGGAAGTWNLSDMDVTVPDAANRNITLKNIYRTVPGNAGTSFFFVAQIALATSTYADDEPNVDVAANNLLESMTWIEPVTTMKGFVVMPNGYLVGWDGRRLLFSEPYRPHAWPAQYELSTEFEIVALGVWGSILVIGTDSQPYFGQGQSPLGFTHKKVDAVEPCLSRRGMVSTVAGVVYPSINGLVLANSNGINVVTNNLVTKEEWDKFKPSSIFAAQLGLQYIAFNSDSTGFILDPKNPAASLVKLSGFTDVQGIETDRYTGNVHLLAQDRFMEWDPEVSARLQWHWRSKVYHYPKPLNFGAARIYFVTGSEDVSDDISALYVPYNESLFTAAPRLNTLNGAPLGGSPAQSKDLVPGWLLPETRQPLGGSLLYPISFLNFQTLAVRFRVHIRNKIVLDVVVGAETIIRMPTGFKSDVWQFELTGNTEVFSVQIAETPKQLAIV